jgi:hypothetical protein
VLDESTRMVLVELDVASLTCHDLGQSFMFAPGTWKRQFKSRSCIDSYDAFVKIMSPRATSPSHPRRGQSILS